MFETVSMFASTALYTWQISLTDMLLMTCMVVKCRRLHRSNGLQVYVVMMLIIMMLLMIMMTEELFGVQRPGTYHARDAVVSKRRHKRKKEESLKEKGGEGRGGRGAQGVSYCINSVLS